jgi:hypothetical protein
MRSIRYTLLAAALPCVLAVAAVPAFGKIDCHSPVTVRIDLASGAVASGAECVRYGGSVTVIVEHVNTLLYDVTVNGQEFRADATVWPVLESLEHPALPLAAHPAVKDYTGAVRKLYEGANEPPPKLRAILYGSPTPNPERLRRDALTVVRTWLGVDGDDFTAVSSAVLQGGYAALDHVERLHLEALRIGSDGGIPQAAVELVRGSFEIIDRDRAAILGRFRVTAEMLQQLGGLELAVASAPMAVHAESFPVTLSVVARPGLLGDPSRTAYDLRDREVARLKVGGGFTLGLGAGLSFSSPVNASYATVTDAGGDEIVERKGDEDAFSAGIDVMLNIYHRMPGDVNHSIALGLGVNDGGGVQYLLGYGVMLGRAQRIVISAGGIGSEVDRLAGGLSVGDVLPPGDSIRTDKEIVLGFYIGATYRFWSADRRQ